MKFETRYRFIWLNKVKIERVRKKERVSERVEERERWTN